VNDDDLIDVKIDGKSVSLTLGELKKRASAGGAVEQRLQEATEHRNSAQSTSTRAVEEANRNRQVFRDALTEIEGSILTQKFSAPDKTLRETNPTQYFALKEEYEDGMKSLEQQRTKIRSTLKHVDDTYTENYAHYKQQQARLLAEKLPVLTDPTKGRIVMDGMLQAAVHYGFTQADIAFVADHRVYLMANDAAKYRALMAKKTVTADPKVTDVSDQKRKAPRVLRSGATALKTRASAKKRADDETRKKASTTGKVHDVAAFIRSSR
jgi:hypothetical protein